jgi:hypothetical protein
MHWCQLHMQVAGFVEVALDEYGQYLEMMGHKKPI